MAIQSSINNLLSQTQRLATYYQGIGQVKKIAKAQELENKWMEEAKKILSSPPGPDDEINPTYSLYNNLLANKYSADMARGRTLARKDTINQSKSDFNAHVANLIKEYGKGSERP